MLWQGKLGIKEWHGRVSGWDVRIWKFQYESQIPYKHPHGMAHQHPKGLVVQNGYKKNLRLK